MSFSSRAVMRVGTCSSSSSTSSMMVTSLGGFEQRRFASRRVWKSFEAKRKGGQRDSNGKIIIKQKEKAPPLFTPLPVEQLRAPVFEVESRQDAGVGEKLMSFDPKNITKENVAQAMEFIIPQTNDPAKQFGVPKNVWKEFRLLGKGCSVVRDVTVETVDILAKAVSDVDGKKSGTRVVLTGSKGCGKSFVLLQAVEWAAANGWVVVYIPRAVNLVNSTTPYAYDMRTQTFFQPEASYQILSRTRTANANLLKSIKLSSPLIYETTSNGAKKIPASTTLYDLINIAKEEVAYAPIILDKLMKELQGQKELKVLLAVDDVQSVFCRTKYMDTAYKPIKAYHMQVPRLLLEFASGKRKFANGAFISAINASDPQFTTPLALSEALELETNEPVAPLPYEHRSKSLYQYAQGLKKIEVPNKLTVDEAAAMFEIWMKQRVLGSGAGKTKYDELFLSKYVESSGNARDFVWKGLLSNLEA